MGMVCIYCGGATKVVNSRAQKKLNQTWRRRECKSCKAVFTTVEAADLPVSVLYVGKHGNTEPFQRDILFISIYESCKHRPDAATVATDLTRTIISQLLNKIENASLNRGQVIDTATEILKRFDKASVVQYQAYHPV